jgi:hypothetical protein
MTRTTSLKWRYFPRLRTWTAVDAGRRVIAKIRRVSTAKCYLLRVPGRTWDDSDKDFCPFKQNAVQGFDSSAAAKAAANAIINEDT